MYPYINIFGRIITTYGFCMLIAFVGAVVYVTGKMNRQNIQLEDIIIVAASTLGFCLLGGKILYIMVTFSVSDLIERIRTLDFIFLMNGGIVFYGGLLGGIIGAFIGAKIAKIELFDLEFAIISYLPVGHAIGRIGCLLAGCCYGMEYNGIGAIYYRHSIYGLSGETGYFPIQLVESTCNIFLAIYLSRFVKKYRRPYETLFRYLFLYAIIRFILEFFRGDANRGIYSMFSTSQWVSIGIIILCLFRRCVFIRKYFLK